MVMIGEIFQEKRPIRHHAGYCGGLAQSRYQVAYIFHKYDIGIQQDYILGRERKLIPIHSRRGEIRITPECIPIRPSPSNRIVSSPIEPLIRRVYRVLIRTYADNESAIGEDASHGTQGRRYKMDAIEKRWCWAYGHMHFNRVFHSFPPYANLRYAPW